MSISEEYLDYEALDSDLSDDYFLSEKDDGNGLEICLSLNELNEEAGDSNPQASNAESIEKAVVVGASSDIKAVVYDSENLNIELEKETDKSTTDEQKPEAWKANARKNIHGRGLSYVIRNGVEKHEKPIGPPCNYSCIYSCAKKISTEQRRNIHHEFWGLTPNEKHLFYEKFVKRRNVKRRRVRCPKGKAPRRKYTFEYYFNIENCVLQVCKRYFLNTLGISDQTISYFFEKYYKEVPKHTKDNLFQGSPKEERQNLDVDSIENDFTIEKSAWGSTVDDACVVSNDHDYAQECPKYDELESNQAADSFLEEDHSLLEADDVENEFFVDSVDAYNFEALDSDSVETFDSADLKSPKLCADEDPIFELISVCIKDETETVIDSDAYISTGTKRRNLYSNTRKVKNQKSSLEKCISNVNKKSLKKQSKSIGPACTPNCHHKCNENISIKQRENIHKEFLNLTLEEKHTFYGNYVKRTKVKRRRISCAKSKDPRKKCTFKYHLNVDNCTIQVCKRFFLNTLNISEKTISYFFKKYYDESTFQPSAICPQHELSTVNDESDLNDDSFEAVSVDSKANLCKSTCDNDGVCLKNSKKIKSNPATRKQNVRKSLREKGLPYFNKDGVGRRARTIGPTCISNCLYECTKKITTEQRQIIHKEFWGLTLKEKHIFYANHVQRTKVKRRRISCAKDVDPRKKYTFQYHLNVENTIIQVCRTYFLNTLDISTKTMFNFFKNYFVEDSLLSSKVCQKNEINIDVNPYIMDINKQDDDEQQVDESGLFDDSVDQYSCGAENNDIQELRSKQRKSNPAAWKRNIRKNLRERGLPYVNTDGVQKRARKIGPPCRAACLLECTKEISTEQRQIIHKKFWNLTLKEKHIFYANYVKRFKVKRRRVSCPKDVEPRKKYTFQYHLSVENSIIQVCRTFFLNTLDISERTINYFFEKYYDKDSFRTSQVLLMDNSRAADSIDNKVSNNDDGVELRTVNKISVTKKRSRKSEIWQQNVPIKLFKNTVHAGNKYDENPAKHVNATCLSSCPHACTKNITWKERQRIHAGFQNLTSNEKHSFYLNFIKRTNFTLRTTRSNQYTNTKRQDSFQYYLNVKNRKIQVCQKYFLETLVMPQSTVLSFFEKSAEQDRPQTVFNYFTDIEEDEHENIDDYGDGLLIEEDEHNVFVGS